MTDAKAGDGVAGCGAPLSVSGRVVRSGQRSAACLYRLGGAPAATESGPDAASASTSSAGRFDCHRAATHILPPVVARRESERRRCRRAGASRGRCADSEDRSAWRRVPTATGRSARRGGEGRRPLAIDASRRHTACACRRGRDVRPGSRVRLPARPRLGSSRRPGAAAPSRRLAHRRAASRGCWMARARGAMRAATPPEYRSRVAPRAQLPFTLRGMAFPPATSGSRRARENGRAPCRWS